MDNQKEHLDSMARRLREASVNLYEAYNDYNRSGHDQQKTREDLKILSMAMEKMIRRVEKMIDG